MHDAVELDEPVERSMARPPTAEAGLALHAVLASEIAVQLVPQVVEPTAQFRLRVDERASVKAVLGLHGAEPAEGAVRDLGALFDIGE